MDNSILIITLASQVVIVILLIAFYSTRVKRVGPNEALIVSGRGETREGRPTENRIHVRVVIGGRTLVWPILEKAEALSLELAGGNFDLGNLRSGAGERITITGKMQYKIIHDHQAAAKAAMHLLSKTESEKTKVVMDLVEDVLRRMVEESTREEIEQSPVKFGDKVIEAGRPRLGEMGIEVKSLIIEEVR